MLTNVLLLPLLASVLLMGGLVFYTWRLREAPGAIPFMVAASVGALWALISSLDLESSTLATKVLLSRARLFVLAPMSVVTLALVMEHTTQETSLVRKKLAPLCILPLLTWGLLLSEDHHHLLRFNFHVDAGGLIPVLRFSTGPWWVLHFAYGYTLCAVACLLLVRSPREGPALFFRRDMMMLIAILVPAASDCLNALGLAPIPGYNLTPSLLAATSLLLWWALLYDRALDIVPIARSAVVDTMTDPLLIADTRARLVDANPAARQQLALPADSIGRSLEQILEHWPDLAALWQRGLGVQEVRVNGRCYDARILPIGHKSGRVLGRLVLLTDVQARKELEETLQRAKDSAEAAAEARSLFLAHASQELSIPVRGVIGMLERLRDGNLGAQEREQATQALKRAEDQLSLLHEFLDFSRLEADHVELESRVFLLDDTLQEVVGLFAEEFRAKGVEHAWAVEPEVPSFLRGDATRLKQILVSLVSNALKSTPAGSVRGTVSCRQREGHLVRLEFGLRDTGVGIPQARHGMLFQPFIQANASHMRTYGSAGLGLAICKRLCERMGGSIGFESEEGRGTRFWFTACLETVEAPHRPLPTGTAIIAAPRPKGESSILVAEDDPTHRRILASGLERKGFRVQAVADGRQALEVLRAAPVDLVVLDCQMPEVSGYDVARAVRAPSWEGPNHAVPLIALTSSATTEDRQRCLDAGMDDFLAKPIKMQTLLTTVEKWIAPAGALHWSDLQEGASPDGESSPLAFDDDLDSVLARLATDLAVPREQALQVLRDFLSSLPATVEGVCQQVRTGDAVTARLALHRLRRAVESVGLRGFGRCVSALEALGPEETRPLVWRHLEGMRARADALHRQFPTGRPSGHAPG